MNACQIVSRGSGTSNELMYCTSSVITRIYIVTAIGRLRVYHGAGMSLALMLPTRNIMIPSRKPQVALRDSEEIYLGLLVPHKVSQDCVSRIS